MGTLIIWFSGALSLGVLTGYFLYWQVLIAISLLSTLLVYQMFRSANSGGGTAGGFGVAIVGLLSIVYVVGIWSSFALNMYL